LPRQTAYVPQSGELQGELVVIVNILPNRLVEVEVKQLDRKGQRATLPFDDLKPVFSWGYIEGFSIGLTNEQVRRRLRRKPAAAR